MIKSIRRKVKYNPDLSEKIGRLAGVQRFACNQAIALLDENPTLTKNELSKRWTKILDENKHLKDRNRRIGAVGLFKGFESFKRHMDWKNETRKRSTRRFLKNNSELSKEDITEEQILEEIKSNKKVYEHYINGAQTLYRSKKKHKTILYINTVHTFGRTRDTITIKDNKLNVCLKLDKPLPDSMNVRSFIILERTKYPKRNMLASKKSYRIIIQHEEYDPEPIIPDLDNLCGYDLGSKNRVYTSDGEVYNHLKQDVLDKLYQDIDDINRRMSKLKLKSVKWRTLAIQKKILWKRHNNLQEEFENTTAKAIAQKATAIGGENLKHRNQRRSSRGTLANPGTGVAQKRGLSKTLDHARPGSMQRKIIWESQKIGKLHYKVDPRHTSTTCSCCGHVDKQSRKTQSCFVCTSCYFSAHADHNAAIVVEQRFHYVLLNDSSLASRSAAGWSSLNSRKRNKKKAMQAMFKFVWT